MKPDAIAIARALRAARSRDDIPKPVLFLGEKAQGVDRDALARAKEMEAAGRDRLNILQDTGWFNDRGSWNTETDDRQFTGTRGDVSGYAADVAPHPQAMQAYPNLGNVAVSTMRDPNTGVRGEFYRRTFPALFFQRESPGGVGYVPGMRDADRAGVQLHEYQHAIDAEDPALRPFYERLQQQQYEDRPLERRAFNSQFRQQLTPDERRSIPPWWTEDAATRMRGNTGGYFDALREAMARK